MLLYKSQPLEDSIRQMKSMGDFLLPFTYPAAPKSDSGDLAFFKLNQLTVDGYELYLNFNKGDYGEYFIQSVEIINRNAPFLPFFLVCKLGKAFFGDKHLCYIDFWRDNRKHYCWTCAANVDGEVIDPPFKVELDEAIYEGLEYNVFPKGGIDFH
jgi:hypothetical protein